MDTFDAEIFHTWTLKQLLIEILIVTNPRP